MVMVRAHSTRTARGESCRPSRRQSANFGGQASGASLSAACAPKLAVCRPWLPPGRGSAGRWGFRRRAWRGNRFPLPLGEEGAAGGERGTRWARGLTTVGLRGTEGGRNGGGRSSGAAKDAADVAERARVACRSARSCVAAFLRRSAPWPFCEAMCAEANTPRTSNGCA